MDLSAKERIIFPLDCSTIEQAEYYVTTLKDYVGLFKIGLELFVSVGPEALRRIREICGDEEKIFLDMKFHDIPETVCGAYRAVSKYASFVTVHSCMTLCRKDKLKDIKDSGTRTRVLVVTLLTSLDKDSLIRLGYPSEMTSEKIVLRQAELAKEAGCDGVVCSGLEARLVKERFGSDFIVVVPGIRPSWSLVKDDDQRRIVTPGEAVRNGADYLVVGRPIRGARNPVTAAIKIAEEIEDARCKIRLAPDRGDRKEYA